MFGESLFQRIQAAGDFRRFGFVALGQLQQFLEVGKLTLELLPKRDLLRQFGEALRDRAGFFLILPDVFAFGLLLEVG